MSQLAHDVAAGLAYLHPSVVHRDLKPQVGRGDMVVTQLPPGNIKAGLLLG